jgi:hypothetical protein
VTSAVAPQFWNSTLGTDGGGAKCIADGKGTACYFAATAYESLTNDNGISGVFVINSLVDTHQLGSCFGLYCFYPGQTCTPDQLAAVQAYALELRDAVLAAQAPFGDRDGCVCLFIFCLCFCLRALLSGLILLESHFDATFFPLIILFLSCMRLAGTRSPPAGSTSTAAGGSTGMGSDRVGSRPRRRLLRGTLTEGVVTALDVVSTLRGPATRAVWQTSALPTGRVDTGGQTVRLSESEEPLGRAKIVLSKLHVYHLHFQYHQRNKHQNC